MGHIAHAVSEQLKELINRANMWVYIKYSMLNQLLGYLPNTRMECIVFKKIGEISFHQNFGGN